MDEHQRQEILQKARAAVHPDRREADAWRHRQWREQHRDRYGILDLGESRKIERPPQPQQELVFKTHHNDTPAPSEQTQESMFYAIAEALALTRIEMRKETRKEMRKYVDKKFAELRNEVVKSNVEPIRKPNVA